VFGRRWSEPRGGPLAFIKISLFLAYAVLRHHVLNAIQSNLLHGDPVGCRYAAHDAGRFPLNVLVELVLVDMQLSLVLSSSRVWTSLLWYASC
jgi:hypothetical protein